MMLKRLLLSASVLALSTGAVSAQTVTDAVATDQLETEIIVTGEKISRSLQETPTSVAVTTARRLEMENIETLSQVFQRTANVSETYGGTGFTIRGLASRGVSGGGDAPLATVYLDGAAIPDGILGSGPTDMWDMAQVELFRGPQSTLQGLNALAGAVILKTQDPTFDWDARIKAGVATAKTRTLAFAGGGPLVGDELAFRVSAEKRASDGYVYNVLRDRPASELDSSQVRAKLLWRPDALPDLEARLGFSHYKRTDGYIFTYVDTTIPDFYEDRQANVDADQYNDIKADIGTLDLSYALADGLSLSSVTNYSETDYDRAYDGDYGPEARSYGHNTGDYKTFSQEMRLSYDSDGLKGLLGAFYYNRDETTGSTSRTLVPTPTAQIQGLLQGAGLGAAAASSVASLYTSALPNIPVRYNNDNPMKVETMAVFGDGRMSLGLDGLSLLAGFRYDRERNRVANAQTALFDGTLPAPSAYGASAPLITAINNGVLGLVKQASGNAAETRRTFHAFLPKLGAEMEWTDDLSTSFIAQRGYRSGGSSLNTARSQSFAYDPEFTWNYELSMRSQWLDDTLTVNANVYYVDWKDQQTSANFGLNLYDRHTVNAGQSHVYGGELEISHRLSSDLDWYASIGHTRTKFDEFKTNLGTATDYSGREFPYAAHWTLGGGVNLRFGDGFLANVNASYRSKVYDDVTKANDPNSRLDARTLVNARLAYEVGDWTFAVYANNLFDEHYLQYNRSEFSRALLGDPRVVGLTVETRL